MGHLSGIMFPNQMININRRGAKFREMSFAPFAFHEWRRDVKQQEHSDWTEAVAEGRLNKELRNVA